MPLPDHITPEPNPPLTMQRAVLVRTMYVEKFTVSRILAHGRMSLGTLYACLDGVPFGASGPRLAPIPRRRTVLGKRRPPLPENRVSLMSRLWRTAERQVRDIEVRLAGALLPPVERERDVRMLGALVKTLRDLAGLDALAPLGASLGAAAAPEDESGAGAGDRERDIGSMRAELMRRIENLCNATEEAGPQPSEEPAGKA